MNTTIAVLAAELPAPTTPPGAQTFLNIISWFLFGVGMACMLGIVVIGVQWAWAKWSGGDFTVLARLPLALAGIGLTMMAPTLYNAIAGG